MLHNSQKDFIKRHIGPSKKDQEKMLKDLNFKSLDEFINSTIPEKIQFKGELNIGEPNSEYEALRKLKAISKKNQIYSNFIGMGYYGTYTPYVILRNILENPGWYTSYTPYQPEVAQGRLIAREKTKIFNETELPIGEITSGTFGPSINGPIAMGYVDKEFSKIDTKILLEVRGKKHPANICKLPFYKKSYVKGVN